jgi:multidrug efflux pump subunit AcrB
MSGMGKVPGIFNWKRIILMLIAILFINGVMAWFSTPREEDPQLAERHGIVTCIFPGATPDDMERLVAKPIEDELAQVEQIKFVETTLRSDFMFLEMRFKNSVATEAEVQSGWDRVQEALDRAAKKLPDTASKPELNHHLYDQDAVLLSLSGPSDPLATLDQARALKSRLQSVPDVKDVELIGSPAEQLSVVFDDAKLRRHGVSFENVVGQLVGGNAFIPSGDIRVGTHKVSVLTNSYYRSAQELERFPIILKSGDALPLGGIARVSRTPSTPCLELMRQDGKRAMGLGVVAQKNVNLQRLGQEVRKAIEEVKASPGFKAAGIQVEEVSYQPRYVDERIFEIGLDLLKSVFLVGGVLVLMLGLRIGSIVALQVPVVAIITFGLFSAMGGVLNQVSLAAFILAIGLLVDNVVVMVDGVQNYLDEGLPPMEAAERTRRDYMIPLAAGTLATLSAFVPILLAKGMVADFVRAVAVVASTALVSSYFFSVLGTPIIASWLLKKGGAKEWRFIDPLGAKLGRLAWAHPKRIIAAAVLAVVLAAVGFHFVKKQFFPLADRDLLIVQLQLPEGTAMKATDDQAKALEQAIAKDPAVVSVTSLVGRGVPLFYYNLPREPNSPHLAQLIVRLKSAAEAKRFKQRHEQDLQALAPYATLIIKEIEQGPPVKAPIEVRIYSRDRAKLQAAADQALAAVRSAEGVDKVRSTMGVGMMNLRIDVDDAAAGTYGIRRAVVSGVVLGNTLGIPITTFRATGDPFPVKLMSQAGEESRPHELLNAYLGSTRTDNLTVGMISRQAVEFSPTVIHHRNRIPMVSIYAQLAPGAAENEATDSVASKIKALAPQEGVTYEMAGAQFESKDATLSIMGAVPVGVFCLLLCLMFEFNSFRRVGIILLTIPLCVVGAVPGLLLTHSTFGFMTLLGVFTLAGTVVPNGIFLIDYIDKRRKAGVPLQGAITEGIQRRMQPILLTATSTIVELIPLTMTKATLWPPFAWAIIFGLAVAALLTLLVLPSVFKLTFGKEAA